MKKKELMQLLSDSSSQIDESSEQRYITDGDFDKLAEVLEKHMSDKSKYLKNKVEKSKQAISSSEDTMRNLTLEIQRLKTSEKDLQEASEVYESRIKELEEGLQKAMDIYDDKGQLLDFDVNIFRELLIK